MRLLPAALLPAALLATAAPAVLGHSPSHAADAVYQVGAATADITPTGPTNLGGFGLGDGRLLPEAAVGRGDVGTPGTDRIKSRAFVITKDGESIAVASVETQGYFTSYQDGPYGLEDMAAEASKQTGIPADHILIAADHTHSGPDTIGAWGGVSQDYLRYIKDQTVRAIVDAYSAREDATLKAGHSDASDLVYNQSCTEAVNQDKEPTYPGPELCATPGKDGMVRTLQATSATDPGRVVLTFMSFAAHATAGGGNGISGDWPQYVSEAITARFGGTGIAMVGALGGTQPCRSACAFTDPSNPGYDLAGRRQQITANYLGRTISAVAAGTPVDGPVTAAQSYLREPVVGPAVLALLTLGEYDGARLLRNVKPPYVNGNTIRTVASSLRVGGVIIAGTPGEGFPAIGQGIRDAIPAAQEVFQLGLANDQLGYLISPARYVPIIAAEVPVNDNIIFNVSPTIGDHVMCADIRLSLSLGFPGTSPATCAPYDAVDATGDPIGSVPVGGVVAPYVPAG